MKTIRAVLENTANPYHVDRSWGLWCSVLVEMFDRVVTPLFAALVFVAVPGSAEEPEIVLLNNKVLVCDAEGCSEILAEDTEVQAPAAEPIIETPALKPEPQPESERHPTLDELVVDTSLDDTPAPENKNNDAPDDRHSFFNDRGSQWMMGLGALGILGLTGFGLWIRARTREKANDVTADEASRNGEEQGIEQAQDGVHLSVRNISILDNRFSKFDVEIANMDQSPASSVRIEARIIVHRLEKDPGDASVTAEKKASAVIRAIPGDAADKVTLGIFVYRKMFEDRSLDHTAYDVEVNGTIHWTDTSDESREEPFAFCAPGITGKTFIRKQQRREPAGRKPEVPNNACFVMLPMPILDYYAENVSQ